MATYSSIRAWKILWTEKPGGLQSMGLQRFSCFCERAHTHTLTLTLCLTLPLPGCIVLLEV